MAQEKQRNTDTKKTHENLVIVESPAKAKTIEKFLGKDYTVMSSYGHIRDLSKKELGIAIDDNFKPDYEISPDKKKLVESLAKSAKEAERVWLASDEDREGEAIAWHLTQVLGLPVDQTRRIVFHEITKSAIMAAIENPRTIDMNLVNAQQARRVQTDWSDSNSRRYSGRRSNRRSRPEESKASQCASSSSASAR